MESSEKAFRKMQTGLLLSFPDTAPKPRLSLLGGRGKRTGVLPLSLTERTPSLYCLILSANPCQSTRGDLTFVMVTKREELFIPAPDM